MTTIHLSWHEYSVAAHVGQLRTVESIRAGLRAGHDRPIDETEGAAAEMAVAKALGLYWDGSVNNFEDPDIGEFHVRHTVLPHGSLIVRPRDLEKYGPDARFVLVTGQRGTYQVHGEISAKAAAVDEFKKAPGGRPPAFFVPQPFLTPLRG